MSARSVLLTVLAEAASQEQERMRNAVTQLQQWETTPQFNATLQVRYSPPSLLRAGGGPLYNLSIELRLDSHSL